MSYSYSGDPSSSLLDRVRFLIGDTDSTDWLLSNEEILYTLSTVDDNIYQSAHDCCAAISSIFARRADGSKSVGDLSMSQSWGNRAEEYRQLGDHMMMLNARREPPIPTYNPNAIVSTADKLVANYNSDFYTGQMDNRTSAP